MNRRSETERIAALEARIAALKARLEQKKIKRDPALKHVSKAVRAIDTAMGETKDHALRKALEEARTTLSACLSLSGLLVPGAAGKPKAVGRRSSGGGGDALADSLLSYVRSNPGQRGEQIAAALGTDTKSMRPTMKQLIEAGKVRTSGRNRGMTYTPA
jgi:hypothetical protein